METIKLSRKNFWYQYWSILSFRSTDAPLTTCDLRWEFMWKTFLALVTFPVFIMMAIFSRFSDGFEEGMQDMSLSYTLCVVGQFLGFLLTMGIFNPPILIGYIFGPIIMLSCVGLAVFIGFSLFIGIRWISRTIKLFFPGDPNKVKTPSIVKTLYLGWKDKLCSRITYVD